jgi:hypothetical protein
MNVRHENRDDADAVAEVHREAFGNHQSGTISSRNVGCYLLTGPGLRWCLLPDAPES